MEGAAGQSSDGGEVAKGIALRRGVIGHCRGYHVLYRRFVIRLREQRIVFSMRC